MGTTAQNHIPFDLGIATNGKKVFLYANLIGFSNPFRVCESPDGFRFKGIKTGKQGIFVNGIEAENTLHFKDFRVTQIGKTYFATYLNKQGKLCLAMSSDLVAWQTADPIENVNEPGVLAPKAQATQPFYMYVGEGDIKLASSTNLRNWKIEKTVLTPRSAYFDKHALKVESVFEVEEGIVVLYSVKEIYREGTSHTIGAALFDVNDPAKLLWRRDIPLFDPKNEKEAMYPLGGITLQDKLILYFGILGKSVVAVHFDSLDHLFEGMPERAKPQLQKHHGNPILQPVLEHVWENQGSFNPAALVDEGKVHIVYRAQGNNTSYLGYAISSDGKTIDQRFKYPIFSPSQPFDTPGKYPMIHFMSGGGYGGVEDPRLTKIEEDERIYLTYVAYNGIDAPRVALSSIAVQDFRDQDFNAWETAKLISPPNVVDKNCVVFPEKVQGKYVIMHRVFPNILVDFVDDLEFNNGKFLKGEYIIEPQENSWDSRKVGAGAPPIKTKDGWLLIYHAVDDRNDSQYKIGAMLLDLKDPTKVLHRTRQPILTPTEHYENHGFKAGVAYPCGAVIFNGELNVYYGAADSYTCVASHDAQKFLEDLKSQNPITPFKKYKSHTVMQHHYA